MKPTTTCTQTTKPLGELEPGEPGVLNVGGVEVNVKRHSASDTRPIVGGSKISHALHGALADAQVYVDTERPLTIDDLRPGDMFVGAEDGSSFGFYDGDEYWCVEATTSCGWRVSYGLLDEITMIEPKFGGRACQPRIRSCDVGTEFTANIVGAVVEYDDPHTLVRVADSTRVNVGPWETFDEIPMGAVFVDGLDHVGVKTTECSAWCGYCVTRLKDETWEIYGPFRPAKYSMTNLNPITEVNR